MRRESVVLAWGWAAAFACGGEADVNLDRRSAPVPPLLGIAGVDAGPDAAGEGSAIPPLPGLVEPPPFVEPSCPPARPQRGVDECDPLAAPSGCPLGQACFPTVEYPMGLCEVERFSNRCLPAGAGTQGESCSTEPCAADHICVSTGRGTQCVRLCGFATGAPSVCAPGLLCLPIDIEGFGGCL